MSIGEGIVHSHESWTYAIIGFTAYLAAAGRSEHTIRLRNHYLGRLGDALGITSPWTATLDDLTGWLARPGWKPETRKSARASVTTFYAWGEVTGRVPVSPAARLPKVGVPRGTARPVPDRVFTPALWQASDRDRLMLMLAGYAGLRRAEIAQVHPNDIDHEGVQLWVRGKGNRERWVPLHPELYEALTAEIARRVKGFHGTGYRYHAYVEPDGWLFPGRVGHIGPDAVGKVLAELLGEGWTGHTLRHRFATRAYAVERDLRAVQELLGHSKPETTARYVQTPPTALRRAVAGTGLESSPGVA